MSDTRRPPVRLIDIAEKLNLTKVSVSKALRDHPDMAPATRALVKQTAEAMGYVPNYFARSLQSKSSNVLGVIVPKIRHAFFAEVIAGIQAAASERNYEILLGVSDEDPAVERRHIDTFLTMRADGLLVSVAAAEGGLDTSGYRRVAEAGVPLVFFDRAPNEGEELFATVLMDDRAGACLAVERAIARGHRKIAHLGGYQHVNIGRDRRAGYEDALRAAAIPVRDAWIVEGGFDELAGYRGFERLWLSGERPDAFFCASFPLALGAIDAMRRLAPEAVGKILIVFFGLTDIIRFLGVPYICIAQPAYELGRAAVETAMEAMDGAATRAKTLRLPLRLVSDDEGGDIPYLR